MVSRLNLFIFSLVTFLQKIPILPYVSRAQDGMERVLQNKRDPIPHSPSVTFPPSPISNSNSPFILFESGTPNLISLLRSPSLTVKSWYVE